MTLLDWFQEQGAGWHPVYRYWYVGDRGVPPELKDALIDAGAEHHGAVFFLFEGNKGNLFNPDHFLPRHQSDPAERARLHRHHWLTRTGAR